MPSYYTQDEQQALLIVATARASVGLDMLTAEQADRYLASLRENNRLDSHEIVVGSNADLDSPTTQENTP